MSTDIKPLALAAPLIWPGDLQCGRAFTESKWVESQNWEEDRNASWKFSIFRTEIAGNEHVQLPSVYRIAFQVVTELGERVNREPNYFPEMLLCAHILVTRFGLSFRKCERH